MRYICAIFWVIIYIGYASNLFAEDIPTINPAQKQIVPVSTTSTLTLSATPGTCQEPHGSPLCPPWIPDGAPTFTWNIGTLAARGSTTGSTVDIDQSSTGQSGVTVTQTQNWVDNAGYSGGSTFLDSEPVEVNVVKLAVTLAERKLTNDLDGASLSGEELGDNDYTSLSTARSKINVTMTPELPNEDISFEINTVDPVVCQDRGTFQPSDQTTMSAEDDIYYCAKNETGQTGSINPYLQDQWLIIRAKLNDYPDVNSKTNCLVQSVFNGLLAKKKQQDIIYLMFDKYSVNGSMYSMTYGLTISGGDAETILGLTTVADTAFSSEGWLASILEHEGYHASMGPLAYFAYVLDVDLYKVAYYAHLPTSGGCFAAQEEVNAWGRQFDTRFDLSASELETIDSMLSMYVDLVCRDTSVPPTDPWPARGPE